MRGIGSDWVEPDLARGIPALKRNEFSRPDDAPYHRFLRGFAKDNFGIYRLTCLVMRKRHGWVNAGTGKLLTVKIVGWKYA